MENILIPLTARKVGPSKAKLTRPRVYYLPEEDLKSLHFSTGSRYAEVKRKINRGHKIEFYETPTDVKTAQDRGATANVYTSGNVDLAITASGASHSAAYDITKYLNNVSAGNGLGVQLPDPFVRNCVVIINGTTGTINVFPINPTGTIDGATAAKVIPAGKRMHFAAEIPSTANTTGPWKSARDAQNA